MSLAVASVEGESGHVQTAEEWLDADAELKAGHWSRAAELFAVFLPLAAWSIATSTIYIKKSDTKLAKALEAWGD